MIGLRRRDGHAAIQGQTLVEFALVLPIFIVMILGIVDVGRFVYGHSTLSQAAREGARLASVEVSWIGSTSTDCNSIAPVCRQNMTEVRADVLAAVNRMMAASGVIADADLQLACVPAQRSSSTPCNPGDEVSISVQLLFQPITPLVAQLVPSLTMDGAATMVVN